MNASNVIFVHSLFRSGSTYIYNALRRTGKFHVYHEPIHEVIASLPNSWNELNSRTDRVRSTLRHDFLSGGYFDEFSHLLPGIKKTFDSRFSFDHYFMDANDDMPCLKAYIDLLVDGAMKPPVLQCTRTSGRIGWLKKNYKSNHIYLLRNPWDQWYSYKVDPYIATTPRIVFSQTNLPEVLRAVFEASGASPLIGRETQEKIADGFKHPITADQDYFLFFGLWVYSFIRGERDCDALIDMDQLSASKEYQTYCVTRLKKLGIRSIDFSDAMLHRTVFDFREQERFHFIESQILEIYRQKGIFVGSVRKYLENEHQKSFVLLRDLDVPASGILEDAYRMRQLLIERDGQIAGLSQAVAERDGQIAGLSQAVAERDRQVASLNESLQHQTKPFRWFGRLLMAPFRRLARSGLLLRIVTGLLLLPAAWSFYGGFWSLLRRIHSGPGAFSEVIAGQATIRERLLSHNRLLRRFIFVCFSLAVRILRAGSVRRSLGNFLRIVSTEGRGGIYTRLITTAPSSAEMLVRPVGSISGEHLVLPHNRARRILVADYRVPQPDFSAGECATVGILKDLCSLGYEVTFLPNGMVPSPRYEDGLKVYGVQVVTSDSGFDSSRQYLEKHGKDFGIFYFIRVDVAETLLPVARSVAPDAMVIYHAPDLHFLREMREAELCNDLAMHDRALQTRDRELAMMRRSDRVVIVSSAEEAVLREMLPTTPISVFPALYAPVVESPRSYAERKNIFFLGGFGHPPNVNAVHWFVSEVWPVVRKALPDVEFHVIGAEVPRSVLELGDVPGVKVVGFVPELEPVLSTLRVGVAPLLYGAGIKGKVAVMMGAGIPCVCTEIAVEGMGIKHDVQALVENDPVRFAQAVVTLYKDEAKWSQLSRRGQSLIRERFGDAANRASLLKVLDQTQALPLSLFIDYCRTADPVAVPNPSAEDEVDVSIIIPVYDKWDFTRACLTSIVQSSAASDVKYEVILADDGSTDETVLASRIFPGLHVVKTPKNIGFLRNCNNAVSCARGRYVLLLNNDTIVLPGWLENLFQTMESDDSIAIVGSKLLYPDGRIQEAGAALFNDGTAINVGRGFGRFTEVFNIRREVDYVSGASILIRKSFWDSVGGFDTRYKNAYCEDSDLAMTARSVGMMVIYEPSSEVIHFEHQSYAEQAPSHNTALQKHNIDILLEKWRRVFEKEHLPAGSEWHLAASVAERSVPRSNRKRRCEKKLNILYFSPFPSHPPSHGNRSTILQFARHLQRNGHRIHFVLLESAEFSTTDAVTMAEEWHTLDILPFSNPMVANGHEIPFDGWYEEGLGERIRLLCAKYDIDLVFCSYIFQSKILEYVPYYILKVIDTHDKMADRYEMLRKCGLPLEFFSCTPGDEGAYLRRADVVLARRLEEARYFDSVMGHKTSIVIPHFEEPHFLERRFDKLKHVGIVASANQINLSIVRGCLEAIERQVTGKGCPFIVHIAGHIKDMVEALPKSESSAFRRPWVRMHGFVPDIANFYESIDLVISPVTIGTGINVKTVQAMAFGMPVVATVWSVKGIETGEAMHAHSNLDSLAASLFAIKDRPEELQRLANVSRLRYSTFFEEATSGFDGLFEHPKIRGNFE